MSLSIRPLQASDIAPCAQIMVLNPLWRRYNVTLASASKRLKSGYDSNASILVAEVDGAVAGFIWYVEKGAFNRSGYIMLIGVSPSSHNSGLGKALMRAAEDAMFSKCDDVFLLVSDFNTQAQQFYNRIGYAQIGNIPDYVIPGITELLFRKNKNSS